MASLSASTKILGMWLGCRSDFVRKLLNDPLEIGNMNYTDICLIPKVDKPEYVDQFRHISLWNNMYKVVTKVLVARLKPIVPLLVSPCQSGFVSGRRIQENIVVAHEIVHTITRKRGKLGYFAINIDLSKA